MFTLSKATEYAILFLASLAGFDKSKPVKLKEIIFKTALPYKFLSRIVLDLKKAKIIISKEGLGGGYILAKKPKDISLIDILKAVEGKKGLVDCIHGSCLKEKTCLHKNIWQKLQISIEKEFKKIKLLDLL